MKNQEGRRIVLTYLLDAEYGGDQFINLEVRDIVADASTVASSELNATANPNSARTATQKARESKKFAQKQKEGGGFEGFKAKGKSAIP